MFPFIKKLLSLFTLFIGLPNLAVLPNLKTPMDHLFVMEDTITTKEAETKEETITTETTEISEEYTVTSIKIGPGPIHYETEIIYSDGLCQWATKTIQEGRNGLQYTHKVVKKDKAGNIVEVIFEENVILEHPVNEIIMEGLVDCSIEPVPIVPETITAPNQIPSVTTP